MYMCIHMCIHVCVHVCLCRRVGKSVCMHVHNHVHAHVCVCVQIFYMFVIYMESKLVGERERERAIYTTHKGRFLCCLVVRDVV